MPLINALYANYRRLYANFAALMLWLSTYDQFATLLPSLMVAPRLFAADEADVLTLGTLTQSANAFGKVFDSLSIVSENWLQVNEPTSSAGSSSSRPRSSRCATHAAAGRSTPTASRRRAAPSALPSAPPAPASAAAASAPPDDATAAARW